MSGYRSSVGHHVSRPEIISPPPQKRLDSMTAAAHIKGMTQDMENTIRQRKLKVALAEASRILAGADLSLNYRNAGYKSARAAAEALVGTRCGDSVIWEHTVEIVEAEIEGGF
jgi:hypothetical protein